MASTAHRGPMAGLLTPALTAEVRGGGGMGVGQCRGDGCAGATHPPNGPSKEEFARIARHERVFARGSLYRLMRRIFAQLSGWRPGSLRVTHMRFSDDPDTLARF